MSRVIEALGPLALDKAVYLFTALVTDAVYELMEDDYNFEVVVRLLNLKDQLRIRSIKDSRLRTKSLMNKLFTRVVLNRVACVDGHYNPFGEIAFSYNEYGKPCMENASFSFSTSSSNDLLCVVVETETEFPIGVDLSHAHQKISPTDFLEQFKGIFHTSELQQLEQLDTNRYIAFNQLWTLKEAFTKLLGTGLNIDLDKFHFDLHADIVQNDSNLDFHHSELLKTLDVKWNLKTEVNVDDLKTNPSFTSLPKHEFKCYSATLIQGTNALPVIVSIVNSDSEKIITYDMSLSELLYGVIPSSD